MSALFNEVVASAFGHLRPEPVPKVMDQDAAEQFAADLSEVVAEIGSETARWSLWVNEGRRSMPALNASEREEMLTELWRWSAVIKSMRKGSI